MKRSSSRLSIAAQSRHEAPARLDAPDGAHARLAGDRLEVFDPQGRLLVRYRDGALELSPASGDLRLSAPNGKVRIEAGVDVEIAAARDALVAGGRAAELSAGPASSESELTPRARVDAHGAKLTGPTVEVRAQRLRAWSAKAELVATAIRASATTVETTARRLDTTAEKVSVRAKELRQEVAGLLESRAARVRQLVRGAFSLHTKTVHMKSEEDTAIDGRRVLLG